MQAFIPFSYIESSAIVNLSFVERIEVVGS